MHINLTLKSTPVILLTFLLLGCSEKKDPCEGMIGDIAPRYIELEIRDNLERDLLSPETPGHYDVDQIKDLNKGQVLIVPATANQEHPGKTMLIFSAANFVIGQKTIDSYIKLSDTVVDTAHTTISTTKAGACFIAMEIIAFKYNKQGFTSDVNKGYFVVHK
ncbi:hypothetical protein GCM10023149_35720 [Mucilaginibacter gynuensis]|uniref:Lipoprotein n=1 Tax=Mucilaginibacter gynuensis TaxID=1302236 RepID=A0ABP8GVH2_9SPHI